MKKFLFTTLLFLGALFNSQAQITTTIKEGIDSTKSVLESIDTSSVTNKVYSDVKAGIVGLAKGLKVGAEEVFTILVKQQIVNSILWLVFLLTSIILLINRFKSLKSEEKWKEDYDITALGMFRLLQIFLSIILVSVSMAHVDTILTGFINPKYGAIKEILNFIS